MLKKIVLIVCHLILFISFSAVAEPIITRDVPVLEHVDPSQCPSSWRNEAGPADVTHPHLSQYDTSGPGVRSCTDCYYQSSTQNCVCKTCYSYFN